MTRGPQGVRYAEVERETKETRVQVVLDLDGGTRQDISTGVGFLDHMLTLFAFHGQFDLGVKADGDLTVDDHHTVEDVGIVLGKAIREALREQEPVERYASNHTPMDDALVLVAVDISGRGHAFVEAEFKRDRLGDLALENVSEFFRALCLHSGITLHLRKVAGTNDHHVVEAMFKGFGLALLHATRPAGRPNAASTKGKID